MQNVLSSNKLQYFLIMYKKILFTASLQRILKSSTVENWIRSLLINTLKTKGAKDSHPLGMLDHPIMHYVMHTLIQCIVVCITPIKRILSGITSKSYVIYIFPDRVPAAALARLYCICAVDEATFHWWAICWKLEPRPWFRMSTETLGRVGYSAGGFR